ncbi:MAG: hypothetical protein V1780_06600 [Chloroflexota bacterium]
MSGDDYLIMLGAGGFFLLLGVILVVWGRAEEKGYYEGTASRLDMREYLEQDPSEHPGLGALKIGGWIAVALGLMMAAVGGAFWRWG